ncbi:MAG: TetR/AcrR family transcriptional regulator [Actinomycetota bacterium]|nr:TetR/AcrR family transcriptional regulator [Actinomycetota bacterium]
MSVEQDRPNSRERLLDAAGDLLRTKGPAASGTTEILARANAPRGSFYFHFPDGKEQLVAEAVERCAAATEAAMIDALEDRSIPMPQRIERFVKAVAAELVADDYRLGCAVGATVLEASATSPSLRQVTETAFLSWTSALIERFAAEGVDPDRASVLADAVIAGLEGATMMARARRDPAPLEHVATTLGAMVAAALDESLQAA